jgi:hypothetical protein
MAVGQEAAPLPPPLPTNAAEIAFRRLLLATQRLAGEDAGGPAGVAFDAVARLRNVSTPAYASTCFVHVQMEHARWKVTRPPEQPARSQFVDGLHDQLADLERSHMLE